MTSSSRPGRSGPWSNQTASTMRPRSGARRFWAAVNSFSVSARSASASRPEASTRYSDSAAATVPVGVISSVHSPMSSMRVSRRRRASWWSRKVWSTPAIRALSRPAGTGSAIAWLNGATGPLCSLNQWMIGVSGTPPTPSGTAGRRVGAATSVATAASASTVLWVNTSRGVKRSPALRARLISWMEPMLSPPSSKKLCSTPTRSTPSTSAYSVQSSSSRASAGARPSVTVISGAGRALRSSLPLIISGRASRGMTSEGVMYSGSSSATCARRVSASSGSGPAGTT
ncbi:putative protein OS=Streptomyces griseus OX=1911 GN=NCTC13033_05128 PE=4 SV=1 [Streptomyces griseus subsp. griseus]